MLKTALRFLCSERGATAIEYGMIAALIAVAIVAAVLALGQGVVNQLYTPIGAMFAS